MILLTRTDITRVYEEEKELKRVKHEAQTDSLTGLYNHKTSLRLIGERLAACPDAPATVLFVDLDNFKQVNDLLGHLRGDELLRSLGKTFRDVLRPTDVLGRIGGDEFILFLPGVSGAESVNRCVERLRAAFSALLDDSLRSWRRHVQHRRRPISRRRRRLCHSDPQGGRRFGTSANAAGKTGSFLRSRPM